MRRRRRIQWEIHYREVHYREIQGREIQGGRGKRKLVHLLRDLDPPGGDERGSGGDQRGREVGGGGNGLVHRRVAVVQNKGSAAGSRKVCDEQAGRQGNPLGALRPRVLDVPREICGGGGEKVWQGIIKPRRPVLIFVHLRQPGALVDRLLLGLGPRRRSHIGGKNGVEVPNSRIVEIEEASFAIVRMGAVGEETGVDTFNGWVVWRHLLCHRLWLAVRVGGGDGLLPRNQ
jgi:hypothetical protein